MTGGRIVAVSLDVNNQIVNNLVNQMSRAARPAPGDVAMMIEGDSHSQAGAHSRAE
jgi:hypothetical protein